MILKFILNTIKELFTDPTYVSDIYIHTLILFTFLSCLFIFFIVDLSTNSFRGHIGEMIEHSLNPHINKLKENPFFKNKIVELNIQNIINNTNKEDPYVKINNESIKTSLIIVNVLLWVFIVITVILFNNLCHDELHIDWIEEAIQNGIIFSLIGAIEFIFLTFVIVKFIPVEPSFISQNFLSRIKTKFEVVNS